MTTHPLDTPWMKLPEVCAYSRCGRTTVITALEAGDLRGTQITAGGMWRIHKDDVDAWLRGEQPSRQPEQVIARRRSA